MTPEQTKKFKYWQTRTIIVSMIGYALYYFVRKNFNTAMPSIEATFGITKTQLGIFLTLNGVIYGVSRFVNGFIADRVSARKFMALGLALCALVNIGFGFSDKMALLITGTAGGSEYITALTIIMGSILLLNGYFQGMGVPPVSPLMTHWVPANELATKMSIWNTSHTVGAGAVIILCGYIMSHMGTDMSGNADVVASIAANLHISPDDAEGMQRVMVSAAHVGAWRWCFWIPAGIAFIGSIALFMTLRDTPTSVGLPELEGTETGSKSAASKQAQTAEAKAFIRRQVFRNPIMWILAFANFFVYTVRFAVLDWGPSLLSQSKGVSMTHAGWLVAMFEIAGTVGMLFAGWATDRWLKGRAHRTCVFCMLATAVFITLFWQLPTTTPVWVFFVVLCAAGFCIYGPQALIGIAAANQATKKAAATANGFKSLFGYLSTIVSGIGFGFVAQHFGWNYTYIVMIIMALIGMGILLLMWNAKADGYGQTEEAAEK